MPGRKRKRSYYSKEQRYRKKARYKSPRRAYKGSMVPLASRGYRFDAPEIKTFDIARAFYLSDDNTASITSLCHPVQGTSFVDRIGTRIKVTSIYIRGTVSIQFAHNNPIVTANVPCFSARMTILMDYQPNGSNPTALEVFNNASSVSQLNLVNRDRFKVIKEKVFLFDPYIVNATTNTGGTNRAIYQVKIFKKCAIPIFFNNGNAGSVADINSNNLVMLLQSDNLNAVTCKCLWDLETRCRFADP